MKEQRKFVRLNASIKITYRVLKKSEIPDSVLSRNISAGGISFSIEQRLRKSSKLDLKIEIPDGRNPIRALTEVVWIKAGNFRRGSGMNYFDVGTRFIEIAPFDRNRIHKFVYEQIHRSIYDELPEALRKVKK